MFKIKNEFGYIFQEFSAHIAGIYSFDENDSSHKFEKNYENFEYWLSEKAHAGMTFLENNLAARRDVSLILPNAKTAIIFLFPYELGQKIRNKKFDRTSNTDSLQYDSLISKNLISRYARGKDYHKVLKKNLSLIAIKLQKALNLDFAYRPVIDSIPFFDRAHAKEAHLGFIGKNTMLIRPSLGSFFFIATLLVDFSYNIIAEISDKKNPFASLNCGTCTKCLDACPTNALVKPYFLDANKCLSYLSIEHRDTVSENFIPHFSNSIYGCDICQEVCPYNWVTSDFEILKDFSQKHESFLILTPKEIALMTPKQYEQWFANTAVTRAKYQGLVRNALYHLYSIKHFELREILMQLENSSHELILKTVVQLKNMLA